ncbi:hypothetical protein DCS_01284 [Drechmeria coniospora]|uniref:MOZ protein represents a chromatin-associated acetyltransferase n=1 Tax=Drechmeria coniospora TaxID=98403 RepID=A0A151GSQ8_DRECN|nr:hypothetical protein DCS_01284 [Drechmeria coniospora]KYK60149.1 hypothetical protein DCS_01284 [Drechmeria coniospora]
MPAGTPLMFLYPHLLRAALRRGAAGGRGGGACAGAAAARRAKGTFAPRHGKAIEPSVLGKQQNQPLDGQEVSTPTLTATQHADGTPAPSQRSAVKLKPKPKTELEPEPEPEHAEQGRMRAVEEEGESTSAAKPADSEQALEPETMPRIEASEPAATAKTEPTKSEGLIEEDMKQGGPVDTVLLMPGPAETARQHPHLSPPPYVHHFDSYSLVKQLQDGGYTQAQATTAMKAIRALLAQNLDVAQQSLVSKSDVENETYLFTAACSELGAEVKNNRRLQDEQMRQQRTHLAHEVDILTQSLNQETLTLTDNVRGMFNDRKMTVREEQKAVDSAIQKITYKMSILLSSDSKSEIEGVRWILIRRSVLGIIFMAILTLGMLRYATYVGQQNKQEAERSEKEKEALRKDGGKTDRSAPVDAAAILAAN